MLLPGSHNKRTEKTEQAKSSNEEKSQSFSGQISFEILRPLRKDEIVPREKLSVGQPVTHPSFTKQQKPVL